MIERFQELAQQLDEDGFQEMARRLKRESANLEELHQKMTREAEEKRFNTQTALLVAGSLLGMLAVLVPFPALRGGTASFFATFTGVCLLAFGAARVMNQLKQDPKKKLRQHMEGIYGRVVGGKRRKPLPKGEQPVFAGVISSLAEYVGLPAPTLRFLVAAATPFTFGLTIPLYFTAVLGLHFWRDR